jgi:hypothetical protein
MNQQQALGYATGGAVIGSMITTMMIVSLVIWVLLIIAYWKMFTKAGEAGWKSIIPIYSSYVLFKITWTAKDFAIWFCSAVLGMVFASIGGHTVSSVTSGGRVVTTTTSGNETLTTIMSILALVALLICLIWSIRQCFKMAAAYGKGMGFGFGLLLLPTIFTLILGFGSAEYVGPQD